MSKNEPKQNPLDSDNRFASQKETDLAVDSFSGRVKGAMPCNTAPPKYTDTHILRSGVDSLYLSFQGEPLARVLVQLEQLKVSAQAASCRDRRSPALQLAGIPFRVLPQGKRIYPYVLINNHFSISVAGDVGLKAPPVYIEVSSELLTLYGYDYALNLSRKLAKYLLANADSGVISRIDLCTDFTTEQNMLSLESTQWACRSKKRSTYHEADTLTGYVFGAGGDISARVYDKTHEAKLTEKEYFYPVWRDAGWNGSDRVWRLEFQLRGPFLKEVHGLCPDVFVSLMNSVWGYLCSDWITLRDKQLHDSNASRWPVNNQWRVLQAARFNLAPLHNVQRIRYEQTPSDKSIVIGSLGYLTSYMAKYGVTRLHDALLTFYTFASEHFKQNESNRVSLEEYVDTKRREKKAKYILFDDVELEE